MNFFEVKNKSFFEVNKYIFLSLADSLRDREMTKDHEKIHQIFKKHLFQDDELVLFQGLKEAIDYLAINKKLSIIFLFDGFKHYIPSLTSNFFANLKILRNRAKYRFSAIFAVERPLEESLDLEIFSQFYELLAEKNVYLSIFDPISLNFRIAYLQKNSGEKIKQQIINDVVSLTAGHSNLTKTAIEVLLKEKIRSKDLLNLLLKKTPVQLGLFSILSFLTPTEKTQILKAENLNSLVLLNQVGLIKNGKIFIPIFNEYIKRKDYEKYFNEKIIFNKMTNQIIKGQELISDNLTSLEFKLLKYLIENKNVILTRDDIAQAVWGDIATTTGVSNEAIDQLVFRLRKKIEKDYNKPIVLTTIKGRGFRFSQ